VGTEVVHHPLADADRRVVRRDRQRPEKGVHAHEGGARGRQPRGRREAVEQGPAEPRPAEHVVDDDLQRPRLGELEKADRQHLDDGGREQRAVRAQASQHLEDDGERPAHRVQAACWLGSAGAVAPFNGFNAMPFATMSSASYMTRASRTISVPITATFTTPSATATPASSGTPNAIPQKAAIAKPPTASCETRVRRSSTPPFLPRSLPPWFSVATATRAFAQIPRKISGPTGSSPDPSRSGTFAGSGTPSTRRAGLPSRGPARSSSAGRRPRAPNRCGSASACPAC